MSLKKILCLKKKKMNNFWPKTGCILLLLCLNQSVFAKLTQGQYATLKASKINARSGPSKNCPVKWEYSAKGEPVFLEQYYEDWFKIEDYQKQGGWIHRSLLSANRGVIIIAKKNIILYASNTKTSKIKAYLAPLLRCRLIKEEKDFVKINCQEYKGWAEKKYLWGVYNKLQ